MPQQFFCPDTRVPARKHRREVKKLNDETLLENLRARDTKRKACKKIALALLQQCKDEGLTVGDLECVFEIARSRGMETTLHAGLTLE